MMIIERVVPIVVAARSTMERQLIDAGTSMGMSAEEARHLSHQIPVRLLNCDCFLDKITGRWRYEFGFPYEIGDQLVWGTHMWPLVDNLCQVLRAAHDLLTERQRRDYLSRLADVDHHQDAIAEFVPVFRLRRGLRPQYEVNSGAGGRNVDWLIAAEQRRVLVEVKRRRHDFIELMGRVAAGERAEDGTAPQPKHDHGLLFRNVAEKFLPIDANVQLQGVWVVPDLQQDEAALELAFRSLDSDRVHFAVLGGWESSLHMVVARNEDLAVLHDIFPPVEGGKSFFASAIAHPRSRHGMAP